jgi:hypothetical protein
LFQKICRSHCDIFFCFADVFTRPYFRISQFSSFLGRLIRSLVLLYFYQTCCSILLLCCPTGLNSIAWHSKHCSFIQEMPIPFSNFSSIQSFTVYLFIYLFIRFLIHLFQKPISVTNDFLCIPLFTIHNPAPYIVSDSIIEEYFLCSLLQLNLYFNLIKLNLAL